MLIATENGSIRKKEYSTQASNFPFKAFPNVLWDDLSIPKEGIVSISYDGEDVYGIYYNRSHSIEHLGFDSVSFNTDPQMSDLLSLKINLKDLSVRAKTYTLGNPYDIECDYYVLATGSYVNESVITIYYTKSSETPRTYPEMNTCFFEHGIYAMTATEGVNGYETFYENTKDEELGFFLGNKHSNKL